MVGSYQTILHFSNKRFSTSLRPMGMSDIPSVFSFPGVVRGAAVSHDDSPQASSTVDGMRGLENSSHPIRHQVVRHVSSPSQTLLQSPLRHHRRTASVGRPPIRETLNASVIYDDEEDGVQGIRINQYVIPTPKYRGASRHSNVS